MTLLEVDLELIILGLLVKEQADTVHCFYLKFFNDPSIYGHNGWALRKLENGALVAPNGSRPYCCLVAVFLSLIRKGKTGAFFHWWVGVLWGGVNWSLKMFGRGATCKKVASRREELIFWVFLSLKGFFFNLFDRVYTHALTHTPVNVWAKGQRV